MRDAPADTSEPHFLIVGDSTDVPLVRDMLSRLPADAYGQVFIEVAVDLQIQRWDPPGRMSITWLVRDGSSLVSGGRMAARGEKAAAAASAWISEWMPDRAESHDAPYVLWIGCSASVRVGRLCRHLSTRLDRRAEP